MATKPAPQQTETTEKSEDSTDSPLLDSLGAGVKKLVAKGKERGYITYDELNAAMPPEEVSSEQIEDTMAMLSEMGINLVDSEEAEETTEEVAEKPAAEAEPAEQQEELGRTDDPVRMYLREMGSVELLSREGEIAIAKRIEEGQLKVIGAICESPLTIRALIAWRDALVDGKVLLRDIIDLEATYGGAPGAANTNVAIPSAAPAPAPAAAEPEPAGEGEEGEEAANVSLSAMEESLKPETLKTFSKIAKIYGEMAKIQNRRLATLNRGQKPSSQF
jgi:RNA polymerase primary sigma factor